MAIKTSTGVIKKLFFGSTPIKKVYSGSTLIWQATTYYYQAGTEVVSWVSGGTGGTVTEGASYATLTTTSSTSTRDLYWYTYNAIELGNAITTLYIDWEGTGSGFGTKIARFTVSEVIGDYTVYDGAVSLTPPFSRITTSLDVSGLPGDYYIKIHAVKTFGRTGTTTLTIYNVWGE